MGWFDEQIRQRKDHDQEVFEQSFDEAAGAVLGRRFSMDSDDAKEAADRILQYFHIDKIVIPEEITDPEDRLDYLCRMSGLMMRTVKLEENWYQDAFGPYLTLRKKDGKPVALLPKGFQSYLYYDEGEERHIRIDKKNCDEFESDAMFFYRPLPPKKLNPVDLIKFAIHSLSVMDIVLMLIMMGVSTLLGLLTPKLSYFLFSTVVESKSLSLLLSTLLFMVCVNLSTLLFTAVHSLFSERTGTKMDVMVEAATMMRILSLPPTFFKKYSSGEISQRMNYVSSLCTQMASMVFSTGLTSLFSLAYISQIFNYAPTLVVPSLIIIAANLLFSAMTTLYQMKITQKRMQIAARNSGMGLSVITGVQKIKLSGSEKRMFARWAEGFSEETRITYNPPLLLKLNTTFALIISLAGQFVLYFMAIQAKVDVAEYYAFQTAYGMVAGAMSSLVAIALSVADLKPSLEMARPILETVPENGEKMQNVEKLSGTIELSRVSFRYDDTMPNIIDDFSLKINAGQYVAIVGKTGCGKSTLIRLLLGFEKPQKGAIYYDGKDLAELDKRQLRRNIGTVMQDDKLFMGDIFSNIVICAPRLTQKEAWEAAELSGIADDIRAMPMGMYTLISEGSGGISGGQRQRLMIARAIAPKPRILIFDEATSALDNITQKKVSEALDSLKCTRIVIAHRLSTIVHCDRILVMDKGKIIEDGTYEQLIEKNGYFAELVARQRLDTKG